MQRGCGHGAVPDIYRRVSNTKLISNEHYGCVDDGIQSRGFKGFSPGNPHMSALHWYRIGQGTSLILVHRWSWYSVGYDTALVIVEHWSWYGFCLCYSVGHGTALVMVHICYSDSV